MRQHWQLRGSVKPPCGSALMQVSRGKSCRDVRIAGRAARCAARAAGCKGVDRCQDRVRQTVLGNVTEAAQANARDASLRELARYKRELETLCMKHVVRCGQYSGS
eukprot:3799893-Amphidinium_carterae.1